MYAAQNGVITEQPIITDPARLYLLYLCVQGPGIFFVIPCIDSYKCVDLRTVSFDVPPQEVSKYKCVDLRTVSFDVPPQEVSKYTSVEDKIGRSTWLTIAPSGNSLL